MIIPVRIRKIQLKRLPISLFLTVLITGLPHPVAAEPAGAAAPVKFLRNREVALGLYPEGCRSAAVLTGTGLGLGEDDFPLFGRLVYLLATRESGGHSFSSREMSSAAISRIIRTGLSCWPA